MASEKLRRENVTDERKVGVEKDRVPKMTTHFESLAVKAKGDEVPVLHGVAAERETPAVKVTLHEVPHGGEARGGRVHEEKPHEFVSLAGKVEGHEGSGMSAGGREYRKEGTEMEKSGAQMRTGREIGGQKREGMQEKAGGGGEGRQEASLEEISNLRSQAQQNSMETIRAAEERYEKAKELGTTALQKAKESASQAKDTSLQGVQYAAEKGGALKDTALEKGQQGYVAAKDTLTSAGKTTTDYTMQAKDVVAEKGQTTAQYVAEKAKEAKDTTVDKAAAAKDVTVGTGKTAAGYVGKVAGAVKEKAVVAGWGAAHLTAGVAAEATKKVAGVTSSVAGYTGEKVAGATHTVVGYAGDKLAAAKDVVVSTEEKAAEFAARKKAEAEDAAAKKSQQEEGERENMEKHDRKGEQKQAESRPSEKIQGFFQAEGEGGRGGEHMQQEEGSVLQAIGETIVEIGQTTKDLLVGHSPTQRQHGGEAKEVEDKVEEPYRGAGEGI